jgi:methylmalonyl-CoA mutase
MRSARSNFARNFFGVAGFDIVENLRFERPEDAVDAAVEEAADVIVLCSSDAEYADLVPDVRSALASAPIDPLLVVAGNAETIEGDIDADGFVHLGSPLLDTLRAYQDRLMGG